MGFEQRRTMRPPPLWAEILQPLDLRWPSREGGTRALRAAALQSSGRGVRTVQPLDGDDGAGGVDPNEDEEVREGRERRGHRRELHYAGG
eukprot:scaffold22751_cov30-Phaeocystis_antarctica.AAC.1